MKNSKDKGVVDRSITFWQQGVEEPTLQAFLKDVEEQEPEVADMQNWHTSGIELDEEGNALLMYNAPTNTDTSYYKFSGGRASKIASLLFKTKADEVRGSYRGRGRGAPSRGGTRAPQKALEQPKQAQDSCGHCNKIGHITFKCEKFKALTLKERYAAVRENNLCLICLTKGHIAKDCTMRFVCNIEGCGKRHNRLLHNTGSHKREYFSIHYYQGLEGDLDIVDED